MVCDIALPALSHIILFPYSTMVSGGYWISGLSSWGHTYNIHMDIHIHIYLYLHLYLYLYMAPNSIYPSQHPTLQPEASCCSSKDHFKPQTSCRWPWSLPRTEQTNWLQLTLVWFPESWGYPKWMVYFMENPSINGRFEGTPMGWKPPFLRRENIKFFTCRRWRDDAFHDD